MVITEIKQEKRGKLIFRTDAGFSFPLYGKEAAPYHLEEGGCLTDEMWQDICETILFKRATKRAMHILEQMERTEFQLRQKLKDNGYPEDVVEFALSYVQRFHYVDDLRYAKVYVRYHQNEQSRLQLRIKLQQRGVPGDLIEQALEEEYSSDETEMIRGLLSKKHYDPENTDQKQKMKLYQYLLRKGFSNSGIRKAMDSFDEYLT